MRRLDRSQDEAESQLELWQPRSPSTLPLIIGAVILGLGLVGWGLFATLKPNPCLGRYSSALFAYCTQIPTGWAGGSQFEPSGNLDRYQRLPAEEEESGGAEATVEVTEVVDTSVATAQYAQQFRTSLEADGRDLGPVEVVLIDGEQAVAWDHTVPPQTGEQAVHVRDVITVRSDGAWQIRFIATDDAYDDARVDFEEMLAAWRWKV
jgi:hypothetical protein